MNSIAIQNLKKAQGSDQSVEDYELIIESNKNLVNVNFKEIYQYRDLLFLLVNRDFISKYKQTILGPLWYIIQPLLMTVVFTVIFHKVAKIPTDTIPPILFYLSGLLIWQYFSNCLSVTAGSFISNVGMFSKVYFPRLIIPLSGTISNLFTFGIQLATFLGFLIYFKFFTETGANIQPNGYIFILPLLIIQTAALSLGVGLWISALTVKYRDLQFLLGFFTQLWMYATPIIYPMSIIPKKFQILVALNPMAPIVEMFRCALLGKGTAQLSLFLCSVGLTLVIFISGLIAFTKTEKTFVDTV